MSPQPLNILFLFNIKMFCCLVAGLLPTIIAEEPKKEVKMDKLIALFKALSDRNRLRIVSALLTYDELCGCHLIELTKVTGATISRHMGVLILSGLVESRKDGRWVYYRICREQACLKELTEWIELQLSDDASLVLEEKMLIEITSCEPEYLSRKQRGEERCPKKSTYKKVLSTVS